MRIAFVISLWLLAAPVIAEVWDGPRITFSKAAFADPTEAQNQDRITERVWLTRADKEGMFNIFSEATYAFSSPADTEWAFADLNGNPATVSAAEFAGLVFSDWRTSLRGQPGLATNILRRPGVVHLISEDIYLDIMFTSWGVGIPGAPPVGGEFTYERSTPPTPMVMLSPGLNLYAPTVELGGAVDSCFDLLASLGGPAAVASIASLVADQQVIQQCAYDGVNPTGDDFPVTLGEAYLVNLHAGLDLPAGSPTGCPDTVLEPGINLVGVAAPPQGLDCHAVLSAFGAGVVSVMQRLDERGAFESCATADGVIISGANFPIAPGAGYLLHTSIGHSGLNLCAGN